MSSILTQVKCHFGDHQVSPEAVKALRDNPGKAVYTVCAGNDCNTKIKLKYGSDKNHFLIEEIR